MTSNGEGGKFAYNDNRIRDWIQKHDVEHSQCSSTQSALVANTRGRIHFYGNHSEKLLPVGVPISVIRTNNQATKVKIEENGDFLNFSDVSSTLSSGEIHTTNLESKHVRTPKCAQCQNHGRQVVLKNHKRYCPWRTCRCYKCLVTHNRRRAMASQVAVRRAQAQDKAFVKELANQFNGDINLNTNLNVELTSDADLVQQNSLFSCSTDDGNRRISGVLESVAEGQRLGVIRHFGGVNSQITNLHGRTDNSLTWFPPYKSGRYELNPETQKGNGLNSNVSNVSSSPALEAKEWRSPSLLSSSKELEEPVLSSNTEIHNRTDQIFPKVSLSICGYQKSEGFAKIQDIAVSVKALRNVFELPPESDFLIYRVLKDYGGDFKQASVKIFEAQCDLLRQAALNLYSAN